MATISDSPIAESQRVPAAHPVPEPEHVGRVDAELGDPLGVGGDRDEVLGHRVLAGAAARRAASAGRPSALVSVSSVVKVLDETTNSVVGRVQVAGLLGDVGRVDVGHEPAGRSAVAVVLQRLVRHHRAEVGAADADVDHRRGSARPVCAGPLPGPHPVGERGPSGRAPRARRRPRPGRRRSALASRGSRSAVCSTARSSLTLMCSPANIASIRSRSPARSASATQQPHASRR